jgi:thiamine phosphate synthase YjbQ (UPF0047 family)
MKTLTEYLSFHTKTHRAYVHITPQVEEILRKSGVKEGIVLVSAMRITAGCLCQPKGFSQASSRTGQAQI